MILCVASQRVFIVVSLYFIIDSVRKVLDTPSYIPVGLCDSSLRPHVHAIDMKVFKRRNY
jgi:hypothetical protein